MGKEREGITKILEYYDLHTDLSLPDDSVTSEMVDELEEHVFACMDNSEVKGLKVLIQWQGDRIKEQQEEIRQNGEVMDMVETALLRMSERIDSHQRSK